jgi:dTDP-4-dehydrorhamnose reductase
LKILVVGMSGHVASALRAAPLAPGDSLLAPGRAGVDLDRPETFASIAQIGPDVVINAGAYTDVERAEDEPELAMRLNAEAPAGLAVAARRAGARFIHLSTDYVFDGAKGAPYVEGDAPAPLSAYARSKLAGEEAVRAARPDALIVRVAWVFSPWSRSFVDTMLRLAVSRPEVSVVDDQFGCPTPASAIASGLLDLSRATLARPAAVTGTFHLASRDGVSRAEFAEAVFAASAAQGGPAASVRRVPSSAFPQKAVRPPDTRLDSSRLRDVVGVEAPSWRPHLESVVAAMIDRWRAGEAFIGPLQQQGPSAEG